MLKKWRLSANVKKFSVMVCNDSKVEEVDLKWKCGDKQLQRVDQYPYLGVECSEDCMWGVDVKNVTDKGKARPGQFHLILADRHLNTYRSGVYKTPFPLSSEA